MKKINKEARSHSAQIFERGMKANTSSIGRDKTRRKRGNQKDPGNIKKANDKSVERQAG